MNGDGLSDLVMTTTAGSILCVDHQGQQVWMRGVQIPISIPPTVVNLVEDETPEVLVVNQSGQIFCMAGRNGDPIWQYNLPGKIAWGMTALVAYDLDGDNALEVIAADDSGHVVCLSAQGEAPVAIRRQPRPRHVPRRRARGGGEGPGGGRGRAPRGPGLPGCPGQRALAC